MKPFWRVQKNRWTDWWSWNAGSPGRGSVQGGRRETRCYWFCDASFAAATQWPSPHHPSSAPHPAPRWPPGSLFMPPNSAPPFSKQKPVEDCWAVLQRSSSPITHLPEVILSLSRDNRGESDTKWRLIGPGDEQLSKSYKKKTQFSGERKKKTMSSWLFVFFLFLFFWKKG